MGGAQHPNGIDLAQRVDQRSSVKVSHRVGYRLEVERTRVPISHKHLSTIESTPKSCGYTQAYFFHFPIGCILCTESTQVQGHKPQSPYDALGRQRRPWTEKNRVIMDTVSLHSVYSFSLVEIFHVSSNRNITCSPSPFPLKSCH